MGQKMRRKLFNLIPILLVIILPLWITSCVKEYKPRKQTKKIQFGLVIHGGAGAIYRGMFTPQQEQKYRAKLKEALLVGYNILKKGGSSVDAVEKTINVLENSPLFNAGKGAVFTNIGTNELDAAIMNGKTLNAGAVAIVKHIKNPISLARLVMDKSPHVLLAGAGAEAFAKANGMKLVDTSYFFTLRRWKALKKVQREEKLKEHLSKTGMLKIPNYVYGTVGCAALDKNGNLAAGTSTGGLTNKHWGRIGDSPIIGAGTYANNKTAAISATGQGEYFMRNVITFDISALMEYKNMSLKEAANSVIMNKLVKQGGKGGIIAIDKYGNIATVFNTKGMFRGYMTNKTKAVIKLYK